MSAERAVQLLAAREAGTLSVEEGEELLALIARDPDARRAAAAAAFMERRLRATSPVSRRRFPWMRITAMAASFLGIAFALWIALAQDDVERLIERLSDEKPEAREEAERRLVELEAAAEPALRRASTSSDAEKAGRAKAALDKIARRLEERAALERIRALPKTLPELRILYRLRGEDVGAGTLRTRSEGDAIVLDDELTMKWEGEDLRMALLQTSTPDRWLTPRRIVSKGTGSEFRAYVIEAKEGQLIGGRRPIPLTGRVLTTFALFRIVGALPQRAGYVFEFDSVEPEGNFKPNHRLECLGEERLEIEGVLGPAMKWRQTGNAIGSQDYWVRDGRIVRAIIDRRKEWIFRAP